MGDKTGIEWTDATWNPITGCTKVGSPNEGECAHCYAISMSARLQHLPAYEGVVEMTDSGVDWTGRINLLEDRLDQPLRWTRPRRIFVNSMSDLFHPGVPYEFVEKVFDVMGNAEQHVFQILTKRPGRMARFVDRYYGCDHGGAPTASDCSNCRPHPHVWLGTSIGIGKYARRADDLRRTRAAVRFLSLEPLLGPLFWPELKVPPVNQTLDLREIDWVIVGGESGGSGRPMHPEWVRSIRDECVRRKIPFHFKQWGSWAPTSYSPGQILSRWGDEDDGGWRVDPGFAVVEPRWSCGLWYHGNVVMQKVSKHEAGRELDGRTWDEYPDVA